ncbi:hypothetical protein [Nonomuraea sp. NPDC049141]|uniref:hypothetical protein n=1 Tax=unclassified Nonomuraea TaxID=2593643 RepID=UPI0033EBB3F4
MRDGNVPNIMRVFDRLGLDIKPQDRRRLNTLAGMDPQDVRMVVGLVLKAFEAGHSAGEASARAEEYADAESRT